MDWRGRLATCRDKGMVSGRNMADYRTRSSLHDEQSAATAERRQTIAPVKAEENRGKGVEEREIGGDTES